MTRGLADYWAGYAGITRECTRIVVNTGAIIDTATGIERMRLSIPDQPKNMTVRQPFAFSPDGSLVAGALMQTVPLPQGGHHDD